MTSDLPPYNSNETDMDTVGYNCTFDDPSTADRWRVVQGEPDLFLWLASTGTIKRPAEPLALIELRGQQADSFLSDKILCQDGTATLLFTYWIVGGANLEVCLVNLLDKKFNCTAMLDAQSTSRKVLLSLPQIQESFRVISIKLNQPYDLLIIGSKTTPFFDHRRGRIISNNTMLLCDFTDDFLCLWGPGSGALPSLTVPDSYPAPSYPAAIVIQGTAMLTSDPLKCQTGSGKVTLLFRHWTSGSPTVQACAIGYGIGSKKVECVEVSQGNEAADDKSLLIFDFKQPILEPFTLNIIPQWDNTARNQYLIIDEIVYLGNCDTKKLNKEINKGSLTEQNRNACNYLNHDLTKHMTFVRVLRDLMLSLNRWISVPQNHQFISTRVMPGQCAILESPRFKATPETNTVIFQYYRTSFYAIIRLCLDSCSAYCHRNASTFAQCPSLILEKQLSKETQWHTARIRLPEGTTRFCLVAHNSNKSTVDTVVAIDNIKLASCRILFYKFLCTL
uniref:MAM domain-containing protein n=1 Tax=Elaeophora elaphi TaxID=1147741 RepID=A0A0R3S2I6_9BILA